MWRRTKLTSVFAPTGGLVSTSILIANTSRACGEKAEFVEQARETHDATVREPVFAEAQLNFIVLSGEFGADGLQVPRQ